MDKIRVKYGQWVPWTEVIPDGNSSSLGGIAADLYEAVEKALNIEFSITQQEDFVFGALGPDGKWSGMLGAIQRNETDVAGPYFITQERSTLVDFSTPIGFTQLAIVSGLERADRSPFLIFKIFSLQVWLLIIFSTFVATAAATFIYMIFPSPDKRAKSKAFLKYAWIFYGSLLGKDYGSESRWFLRHMMLAASFRILLCLWLLGPVLVLLYTYQGAITSTFAADKLKPIIRTMDELHQNTRVKPSTFGTSITSICFERLKGTRLHSLHLRVLDNLVFAARSGIPPWLDEVESGHKAFVGETLFMKDLVGKRFKKTGKCELRVTPTDFCTAYISFAIRKNFRPEFQKAFNKRVMWYSEGHLYQKQMLSSQLSYDTCTRVNAGSVNPLNLKDITGAFLLYAIGITCSILVFFIEIMIKRRKLRK